MYVSMCVSVWERGRCLCERGRGRGKGHSLRHWSLPSPLVWDGLLCSRLAELWFLWFSCLNSHLDSEHWCYTHALCHMALVALVMFWAFELKLHVCEATTVLMQPPPWSWYWTICNVSAVMPVLLVINLLADICHKYVIHKYKHTIIIK